MSLLKVLLLPMLVLAQKVVFSQQQKADTIKRVVKEMTSMMYTSNQRQSDMQEGRQDSLNFLKNLLF
jgi:hypothetical protein